MNKLGAFILFMSKGVPLIHQGQEWGHSQIIQQTNIVDLNVHKMDPNPYNKDNETPIYNNYTYLTLLFILLSFVSIKTTY